MAVQPTGRRDAPSPEQRTERRRPTYGAPRLRAPSGERMAPVEDARTTLADFCSILLVEQDDVE